MEINGEYLNNLQFDDSILLISASLDELKEMLSALKEAGFKCRFQNEEK